MESPVLFHDPTSEPSRAAHWLALELGIPVRIRITWLARGEHLGPELLAVNPRHQVPALKHGNLRHSASDLPTSQNHGYRNPKRPLMLPISPGAGVSSARSANFHTSLGGGR